jgi:hypothetical protein
MAKTHTIWRTGFIFFAHGQLQKVYFYFPTKRMGPEYGQMCIGWKEIRNLKITQMFASLHANRSLRMYDINWNWKGPWIFGKNSPVLNTMKTRSVVLKDLCIRMGEKERFYVTFNMEGLESLKKQSIQSINETWRKIPRMVFSTLLNKVLFKKETVMEGHLNR